MAQQTPSKMEAMEMSAAPANVKVEMGNSMGMPMHVKLAHLLSLIIASVIFAFVTAVLADGESVITVKDVLHLPIITSPDVAQYGIKYRIDELLGPTYGIGLHHDQSGRSWTVAPAGELKAIIANLGIVAVAAAVPSVISTDSLKHPVPLLACYDLRMAGLTAMSFGFIADAVAVLMIIFHAAALAGLLPLKVIKPVSGLVWLTLTAGFGIVVLLAIGIYTATWKCDNIIIPEVKLSQHFDYNYGFGFAITGFIASLLIFTVSMVFMPMDGASATITPKPIFKSVFGLFSGGFLLSVGIIIVLGANGDLDEAKPVNPNINMCEGQKPKDAGPGDKYFNNVACFKDNVVQVLEQAGANVTKGYKGLMDAGDRVPILKHYSETDLCPVNVHWHLGAEHLSVGQYDESGKGPAGDGGDAHDSEDEDLSRRKLATSDVRLGHRCHYYDAADSRYDDSLFEWKYCTKTLVGETYEIHWPHSAAGACGTKWQYQTPFYDGVFCNDGVITLAPLNTYEKIGVQGQIFTIINSDEPQYQFDNLIAGMVVSDTMGVDMAYYTGSTTGTSRDNQICSRYTPITWQVDRKCHLVSAKSFDKLCEDMHHMADDMHGDTHPHGARITVLDSLTADNQHRK